MFSFFYSKPFSQDDYLYLSTSIGTESVEPLSGGKPVIDKFPPITAKTADLAEKLMKFLKDNPLEKLSDSTSNADLKTMSTKLAALTIQEGMKWSFVQKCASAFYNLFTGRGLISSAHRLLQSADTEALLTQIDSLTETVSKASCKNDPTFQNAKTQIGSLLSSKVELIKAAQAKVTSSDEKIIVKSSIETKIEFLKYESDSVPPIAFQGLVFGLQKTWTEKAKSAFYNLFFGAISTPHKVLRSLSASRFIQLKGFIDSSSCDRRNKKPIVLEILQDIDNIYADSFTKISIKQGFVDLANRL